ncbi:lantibiotic dehydratase [Streptomyces sp. NPDC002559]
MGRLPLGGRWSMWDLSGLRSAGTPADRLLADPGPDGLGPVRAAMADPWFVAAIAWQNPDLVRDWLGARHLAATAGDPDRPLKKSHQRILGSYLQRYAAKNDVIGFSGPTCSARWREDTGPALSVRPGPDLTGPPRVRYEPWALTRLVESWAAEPRLRRHMPVTRDRSSVVHQGRLFRSGRPRSLDPLHVEILRLADGTSSAERILAEIATAGPAAEADARLAALAELADEGIVDWGFLVPLDHEPEVALRAQIERIPDEEVRAELSSVLDGFDAARAGITALAADGMRPLALVEAMAALDTAFNAATGATAHRRAVGRRTGHGRRTVYLDTTRDVEVVLGAELRAPLAEPLGLVLDSARWLTHQVAALVRETLERFLDRTGLERVPLLTVYEEVEHALSTEPGGGLAALLDELRHRWATVLDADPGQRRLDLDPASVAHRVRTAFEAPDYGWAAARQHTPDLMLAVDRWDGDRPAEFRWILGEVHLAVNTLENRVFVTGHPRPDLIAASVAEDFAGGRIVSTFDRTSPRINARVYPPLGFDFPDRYRHWAWHARDTLPPERDRIPAAGLWLVRTGTGGLRVFGADGGFEADPVEMFGELLSGSVAERFGLLPAHWPHLPRVTLGRLVVARETWRVPTRELVDGAGVLDGLGVPRHSFVVVPGEAKPILLDRQSRVSLLQLARSVRRALDADPEGTVVVSEMLPSFEHLWLPDAAGRRYTSELRVVAVDQSEHEQVLP